MEDQEPQAAPPGWAPPSRPAPPPRRPPSEQQDVPPAPAAPPPPAGRHRVRDLLRNPGDQPKVTREQLADAARATTRSTRASTEPGKPLATGEGLEELGKTILLGLSKLANWLMRKRQSPVDWRMTEAEAASISAPAVRMLSRRMQVRSDLADATDVGGGFNGLLDYAFRVLQSEASGARGAWQEQQDYARARASLPVEHGAPPPAAAGAPERPRHMRAEPEPVEAPSSVEIGQEDTEPAYVGAAVTGGPTKAFFAGFEEV